MVNKKTNKKDPLLKNVKLHIRAAYNAGKPISVKKIMQKYEIGRTRATRMMHQLIADGFLNERTNKYHRYTFNQTYSYNIKKVDYANVTVNGQPVVTKEIPMNKIEEPVVEAVAEPVVEAVIEEPVVESVAEPVAAPVVESVIKEPVVESVAAPVVEAVIEEPVVEAVAEPVVEAVIEEPVVESVAEPVAAPVVEPVIKEPVIKPLENKKVRAGIDTTIFDYTPASEYIKSDSVALQKYIKPLRSICADLSKLNNSLKNTKDEAGMANWIEGFRKLETAKYYKLVSGQMPFSKSRRNSYYADTFVGLMKEIDEVVNSDWRLNIVDAKNELQEILSETLGILPPYSTFREKMNQIIQSIFTGNNRAFSTINGTPARIHDMFAMMAFSSSVKKKVSRGYSYLEQQKEH